MLLVSLVILVGYSLLGPISPTERRMHWLIVGPLMALIVALVVLMRLGHVRFASVMWVLGVWGALTAGAAVGGGVGSPGFNGYVLVVVMAGLLLGRSAAFLFSGLCVASGGVIWYFSVARLLPPLAETANFELSLLASQSFYLFLAAVLFGLALQSIDEALRRANEELDERRKVESNLRESEQLLRNTVKDLQLADARQESQRLWLERVVELGKGVAQVTALNQCLLNIYHSVQHGLEFDRVELYLYDPQEALVRGAYSTNTNGEVEDISRLEYSLQEQVNLFQVLNAPTSQVIIENTEQQPASVKSSSAVGIVCHASVAMWAGDQPQGVIVVDNSTHYRPFADEQLEALRIFAGYAGLAISNARLIAQAQHSERKLRLALEAARMGTWDWDVQSGQVHWSEQAELIFGFEPGQFPPHYDAYLARIYPEDYPVVKLASQQMLDREIESYDIQYRIRWPDNSIHWIEEKGHIFQPDSSASAHITGMFMDISDKMRAIENLQESQRFIQRIADTVPGLLYVVDLNNLQNVFANREVASILGYSTQEIQAMGRDMITILLHPEDMKRMAANLKKVESALDQQVLEFEYRMRAADGSWHWLHSWETVFNRNADGRPSQLLGIAQDFTTRKWMEDKLRRSTERLRVMRDLDQAILTAESPRAIARIALDYLQHLIEARHASVIVFDFAKRVVDILAVRAGNRRLSRLDMPSHLEDYAFDDTLSSGQVVIVDNLKELVPKSVFYQQLLSEGVYSCISVPLRVQTELIGALNLGLDEPGKIEAEVIEIGRELAGILAVAIQQSRLHTQIREHADELEKRVAERTTQLAVKAHEMETFAYSISHDLKAPLRGIDGYSKLLLDGFSDRLGEDGLIFVHTIRWAAQQMNQLINDLLSYTQLERASVVISRVFLPDLIEKVVEEFIPQIEQRSIEIRVNVPGETVKAAPDELADAFRHLISNALKFTRDVSPASIEVAGRTTPEGYLLWVQDNGIGFDMQYHDRIFEVFQRLNRAEDFPGTGIGLALVKKVMQRIGGRVWAESVPGQGATFYLEIPK